MVGEPESLHTFEPLKLRLARHDFDRLLMLSDGVFAIAITLLALEMKVPDHWDGKIASLLAGADRSLVGYVFAFLLVGAFWLAHRRLFAKLVEVNPLVTLLNIIALGLIGLAPFVARLIAERGPTKSIPVYLLLTGAIFSIYAAIDAIGGLQGLFHPEITRDRWRREAIGLGVSAAIILGSGIAFNLTGSPPSPGLLILIVFSAAMVGRLGRRRRQMSSTSRP